ncbi:MAG: hypothetical protein KAU21_11115, partial [Gammaproteobacteria bacterium]|nr:hypothetical protein [Gammaproteobacteria bacterium]
TLEVETELNIQNSETTAAYDVENITSIEAFDAGTSGSAQFEIELSWNMPEQLATVSMVNLIDTSDEVTSVAGSPVTLGSTEVRFGRLNMDNVFGSEMLTLTVPMYVEYYDGNNFVLNNNDTVDCSVINSGDLGVVRTLSGGSSTESVVTPTSTSGRLNIDITLSPAGAGNTGDVDITPGLTLSAEPWLQYDWDGDGNYDNDPTARATFGIYSGDSKQIYFRQIYQ